ncbi:hypothetical protein [Lysobacter gummosus]|uniref:hypothetical protein n=1 Tax=Lysobacter gummosus TaxID=262324 RepID=UPI00363FB686
MRWAHPIPACWLRDHALALLQLFRLASTHWRPLRTTPTTPTLIRWPLHWKCCQWARCFPWK